MAKFTEAGFKPEVKSLAQFEDDYDLEPVEGEDEESDEEEGSEDDEDSEEDEK